MGLFTRRTYLSRSAKVVGAGLLWPLGEASGLAAEALVGGRDVSLDAISPINRGRSDQDLAVTGDEPHRAHSVLWATRGGESPLPPPSTQTRERVKVAVIGGGCAGLAAAWRLRALKPVILEQASRLGGNAKGETWRGVPYSIGAAYLCNPEANGDIDVFLREIGARKQLRGAHLESLFLSEGRGLTSLSKTLASAPPPERAAWERLITSFKRYAKEEGGLLYPEIPTDRSAHRAAVNALDREDFATFCARLAGGSLPRSLSAYLEQYCWTAFGAGMNEISAASGVNFLAGELDEILVGPGGNSWVTEQATRSLAREVGISNLRVNHLVYSVEVTSEGVLINYIHGQGDQEGQGGGGQGGQGESRQILAERVILACPKFVVKRILKGIEAPRLEAINTLKYRAYLVHQALINAPLKDDFYELFLLNERSGDREMSIEERSNAAGITDLTYGNFASISTQRTVLSLYQALPYDSGRAQVYRDISLAQHRAEVTRRLQAEILPALKLSPETLIGVRSSRWGHPLPVAAPHLIHKGVVDELRRPHRDRVFFAQQDNWALPAIEVSLYEGFRAASMIQASL